VNGELQIPIAHLVCNSTPPVGDKPSLMTFGEVETLFHEFGHGLQHMLTVIDDSDAAGINGVEWDAVELPSQFMENWCYHKPTLLGIARHYETGEALPDDLFDKLTAARTFRAGSMMLRQLTFGMIDMRLHHGFQVDGKQSVFDVQREVSQLTSVLPPLPEDRSLCTFSHIFAGGYAAGYYSYKWAEVLSADAFAAFEDAGLDNPDAMAQVGRRFRDTVLSLGGSQHPMDVFRQFRGREPDPQALLRHNGLA
jgi:oligopeptidase A